MLLSGLEGKKYLNVYKIKMYEMKLSEREMKMEWNEMNESNFNLWWRRSSANLFYYSIIILTH